MPDKSNIVQELKNKFGDSLLAVQETCDGTPTLWVSPSAVHDVLAYLKSEIPKPYRMLYDLTAIDERPRSNRQEQPDADLTVLYLLLSFDRNEYIRVKVPLKGDYPTIRTITDIWPSANWYEREVWDMFGIAFEGHPHLRRILMPPTLAGTSPEKRTSCTGYRYGTLHPA